VRINEMGQGQKQSRMVAWTFQDDTARQAWHALRKSQA
jgi:23S rRNA (adenine1618-N6)-methyltransferase